MGRHGSGKVALLSAEEASDGSFTDGRLASISRRFGLTSFAARAGEDFAPSADSCAYEGDLTIEGGGV